MTAKVSDFGFSIQLLEQVGGKTLTRATPGSGLPGTPAYQPQSTVNGSTAHSVMCTVMEWYVLLMWIIHNYVRIIPYVGC